MTRRRIKNKTPRPWREGEMVNDFRAPLKTAAAAFMTGGSAAAIAVLGSRSKFVELAPKIQAQIKFWERGAKRMDTMDAAAAQMGLTR